MNKTAILPAGHVAVSLEALDRVTAAADKTIGLMGLLSAFATNETLSRELSIPQAQGVDRLVSDLASELEDAVEALSPTISTPNPAAA